MSIISQLKKQMLKKFFREKENHIGHKLASHKDKKSVREGMNLGKLQYSFLLFWIDLIDKCSQEWLQQGIIILTVWIDKMDDTNVLREEREEC